MRLNWILKSIVILLIGLNLGACGYHFSGSQDLPNGYKKIAISVFDNYTSERGIEKTFTNDIIYEFNRNQKAQVTPVPQAEAVLSGVIEQITTDTIARSSGDTNDTQRLTAVVSLTLTDADGALIWTVKKLSVRELYDQSSDRLTSERNKDKALKTLSRKVAEQVYFKLTDNF